ncbi:hypothetical protein CEXT_406281 [Caerostris extrusa]|uniref:Uncharacterized protein n=1 Tax=Caerostris extrusa TaxID=172846 RepID=A0AAV4Y1M6_CAEEX|nr:hypothetical protein CEXT_406281 [Caerostris extrusa]
MICPGKWLNTIPIYVIDPENRARFFRYRFPDFGKGQLGVGFMTICKRQTIILVNMPMLQILCPTIS